jgi:hypothetical protein
MGGSSVTAVHGGGIFSNGCLKCNGAGPNFVVNVDPPSGINYAGSTLNCTSDELSPAPTHVDYTIPTATYDVHEPSCLGLQNRTMPGGKDVTLEPGIYDEINDNGKDIVRLNPGLYCVTGGPNAVKITSGSLIGEGVTLFVTQGDVLISGGGQLTDQVYLTPPTDNSNSAIPGVLIYLAHDNEQQVQLTGNSQSIFKGLVYVPDGDILATGTGDLAGFNTQLIGMNVEVDGDAYIDIFFEDDGLPSTPTSISLYQ